jgi:TRAP-type C4-dicarboxylate transport system permease large subunit
MRSAENRQGLKWIQRLIQWFKQLRQYPWLMIIVKFLIPFLIGLFYPNLALLIEVLILIGELWDCFRQV